ncbi:MAG: hypothetical protein ACT4TC_11180 [Myxococcaceae bacterium]
MQLAWLLLGLTLSAEPTLPDCDDEIDSCRETCSLQFGTATSTRGQLGVCFDNCRDSKNRCKELHKEAALEKQKALRREQDMKQRAEFERQDRDQELFKQRAAMETADGGTKTQLGTARTAPAPAPIPELFGRPSAPENSATAAPKSPTAAAKPSELSKSASSSSARSENDTQLPPLPRSAANSRPLSETGAPLPPLPKSSAKLPELPDADSKLPPLPKTSSKLPELPDAESKLPPAAKKVSAAPPDDEGLAPMDDLIKDTKKPAKKSKGGYRSVFPNSMQ